MGTAPAPAEAIASIELRNVAKNAYVRKSEALGERAKDEDGRECKA